RTGTCWKSTLTSERCGRTRIAGTGGGMPRSVSWPADRGERGQAAIRFLVCSASEAPLRLMVAKAVDQIAGRPAFEAGVASCAGACAGIKPRPGPAGRRGRRRLAGVFPNHHRATAARLSHAGENLTGTRIAHIGGIVDAAVAAFGARLEIAGGRSATAAQQAIRISRSDGLSTGRRKSCRKRRESGAEARDDERGTHG